jgi:hypothetical protein
MFILNMPVEMLLETLLAPLRIWSALVNWLIINRVVPGSSRSNMWRSWLVVRCEGPTSLM